MQTVDIAMELQSAAPLPGMMEDTKTESSTMKAGPTRNRAEPLFQFFSSGPPAQIQIKEAPCPPCTLSAPVLSSLLSAAGTVC